MEQVEKIIRPGTKIELCQEKFLTKDAEESLVYYHSKVTDVRDDNTFEAYMPIEQGKLILMSLESRYEMLCYTEQGIYQCSVLVKSRHKEDGLYYVVLRVTSPLQKRQRREHYRYKCMLNLEVREMDSAESKWMTERGQLVVIEETPMDKATIVDISGGGLQFVGKQKYKKDSYCYCKFLFGREYKQCFKVLDSVPIEDRAGEYRTRGKFVGMGSKERENIIQAIFLLERMQRKSKTDME